MIKYQTEIDILSELDSHEDLFSYIKQYFKRERVDRYMYIFMPAESRFNSKTVRIHHSGYENIPDICNTVSRFVKSPEGARVVKLNTTAALQPFENASAVFKSEYIKRENREFVNSDKTGRRMFFPVHTGANNTGLFLLRGPKGKVKLFNSLRSTHSLCQMLHQRYAEIWIESEKEIHNISNREITILNWVAYGKSNSVIGDIMGISKHTVDAYLRAIFIKLSVSDRISASVKASELGLLVA